MPTLTVMEGREENFFLVDDFMKEAEKIGWDFLRLTRIDSDKIASGELDDVPLDYVVFRELTGNDYYEAERVMDYLRANDKVSVNADVAGGRTSTSDKHYQMGLFMLDPFLRKHILPTFMVESRNDVEKCIKLEKVHYPVVLKPRRGTLGRDIILVRNESELQNIKDYRGMVVEQYVEPECDFRVFVIGGAAVGAIRKLGDLDNPRDFKAWCSGRTRIHEKNPRVLSILSKIACKAAAVSGLEYGGMDIIRSKEDGKYYLLETNIAASWSNFVPVTGINIPELVLKWMRDRGEGKSMTKKEAAAKYYENWKKYTSLDVKKDIDLIMVGDNSILAKYDKVFSAYKDKELYKSGYLYKALKKAYMEAKRAPRKTFCDTASQETRNLLENIEKMPFSRMGNYIGPEVLTLDEGMILTAMWFYVLSKMQKV